GSAGDDGGHLAVIHMPDVGETEGRPRRSPDRRVGQDVEAESSVALHPLGVHEWAGGDAQARVQEVTEEPTPRPRGKMAKPREHGRVRIVPLVGAVEAIGAAVNRNHTPFRPAGPGKRLVYQILT